MSNSTRDSIRSRITTDLEKAKEEGKLRTERIREIVRAAVSQAVAELKEGSSEIRSIAKDAISTAIENLQEKGRETKEEVTASIEGAIAGLSELKRESIAKTQAEVKQLQDQINTEETDLQAEVDSVLAEIEETEKDTSIKSAIDALKDTEEVNLMRKRYAQLQAQLAILQANLAARYGERFEEVNKHLDEAKVWYDKTRPQAEVAVSQAKQKQAEFERKLGEAGTVIAQKERQARHVLKELLHSVTDLFQEKEK